MSRFSTLAPQRPSAEPQPDTAQPDTAQPDAALSAALNAALPAEPPSPELRDRIAQMASQADARPAASLLAVPTPQTPRERVTTRRALKRERRLAWRQSWGARLAQPRARWTLSMACVALFFAGLSVVWPRFLSSQALARVEAALAKVTNVHVVHWRLEGGRRIKEREDWFQGGMMRLEDAQRGGVEIYRGGRWWRYSPQLRRVTVNRMVKGEGFDPSQFQFTLNGLIRDIQQHSRKTEVKLLGQSTWRGRRVNQVQVEVVGYTETTTVLLLVDPATDLPQNIEIHNRARSGQESAEQLEPTYNEPLGASVFATKFPGARVVDLDRETQAWTARLARPLLQKRVGERTLAIRDLQVNQRGDVFLLYTAGKRMDDQFADGKNGYAGRDWKVELSDNRGTLYHPLGRADFNPNLHGNNTFDRQRLEGDWWVPDAVNDRQNPWRARTFTLTFKLNPRNVHGPNRGAAKPLSADYTSSATFNLRVAAPATDVVPRYVAPLRMDAEKDNLLRQEAQARGELLPGQVTSPQLWRTLSNGSNRSEDEVWTLLFSPDGKWVVCGGEKGLTLREVQTGRVVHTFEVAGRWGSPLAFTPDGRSLLAAHGVPFHGGANTTSLKHDTQFRLWDVASGTSQVAWVTPPQPKGQDLRERSVAPDGKTLQEVSTVVTRWGAAEGSGERTVAAQDVLVQQRDTFTGRLLAQQVLPHQGVVRAIATSGTRLVTNQDRYEGKRKIGGIVRLWDAQSGHLLRSLLGDENLDVDQVALAPDGSAIAVGVEEVSGQGTLLGDTNRIRLYDTQSGEQKLVLQPPTNLTGYLAFSPDGKLLVNWGADSVIKVWDTAHGSSLSLLGHGRPVTHIAFSPDASLLVSTDTRNRTLLWRLSGSR